MWSTGQILLQSPLDVLCTAQEKRPEEEITEEEEDVYHVGIENIFDAEDR